MKTILSIALLAGLGVSLGISAYIWVDKYHKRPVNPRAVVAGTPKAAESIAGESDLNGQRSGVLMHRRRRSLKS
jgi:hypothetical protein